MQNYSLLKNKIYLVLLARYNEKIMPSYSSLAAEMGITRQTISTRINALIEEELVFVNELKQVSVQNPLNINVDVLRNYLDEHFHEFNAIKLKEILFGPSVSKFVSGKELGMSRDTIYKKNNGVVYGIVYEGKLRYVGVTDYFDSRRKQHIHKRPFLTEDNFIILSEPASFEMEKSLINLLNPEWNGLG